MATTSLFPEDRAPGTPTYELRGRVHGAGDLELEVWQLPATATPHIKEPRRVAGLRGRNLALVEPRVQRLLGRAGIKLGGLLPGTTRRQKLDEEPALALGLLFRTLAPMRSRDNMLACVDGIELMKREEAAYWLGMALHRKNPRRVLGALRILLTDPAK